MATIRSLIVKVGAQTEQIDRALEKLGSDARKTDADLKKLGNTPLGQQAQKSFAEMSEAMNGITRAQERVANQARLTAVGIDQIGGASRLTKTELDAVNRTLQNGLDAYRALGQTAPKELQKVADAVTKQKSALEGTKAETNLLGQAQAFLTSKLLAFVGPAALGLAVKQTLDYADALTKASDQTKIGVVELQRINAVAQPSGNTFEQVADAVTKFQKSLASGAIDEDLRGIGLSVEAIRAARGDEQFFAIAKAIQAIPDPAEQARVAMELFGRGGAELLPTIRADIDGLKDSTVVMSAESVKALDDFRDMLGRLKTTAVVTLGEIAAAAVTAVTEIAKLPKALKDAEDLSNKKIAVPGQLGGRGVFTDEELKQFSPEELAIRLRSRLAGDRPDRIPVASGTPAGLPTIAVPSGEDLERITRDLERQREALNETNREAIEYQRALDVVNKKLTEATRPITRLTDEQQVLVSQYRALGLSNQDIAVKFNVSTGSVDAFTDELDETIGRMAANRAETGRMQQAIGNLAVGFRAGEKAVIGFRGVAQETDPTLLQVTSTTERFQKGLVKLQDVGQGASGVVDQLREAIAKDAAEFEKASFHLDDFAASLAQLAQISGDSFGGLLRAIGQIVVGLDLAGKAADRLRLGGTQNVAGGLLEGATAIAAATSTGNKGLNVLGGAAAGAKVGMAFGPIGAGIGAGVGALVGLFRGTGEKKKVDELRQAWIDASGGWHAINSAAAEAGVTLDKVLNARKVKDYEAALKDLNEAIDFQNGAMATLEETTQKYGFTIDELGPAFARQQLDKQAQTLFQDFSVLTAAGIDLNTVIARMGESINAFAQSAIRTGTEVPEAMRPMLERMVELGLLTDENGVAFESLEESGITFSETMSQGFTRVVDSVERLTEAIARGLGIALDTVDSQIRDLPPVDVDVRFNIPDLPRVDIDGAASSGGRVTPDGIQHFAGGGRVLPFFRRGSDSVPAMLTPGELVLNQDQEAAVREIMGGRLAAGGGAGVDLAGLQRQLARQHDDMPKLLARAVRDELQKISGGRR